LVASRKNGARTHWEEQLAAWVVKVVRGVKGEVMAQQVEVG
jgi:hypothetical protein